MRTYIVLGSPRSGTSFLTKALIDQGVFMGKKFKGNSIHGGYENVEFEKLNRDIIKNAGGNWGSGAFPEDEKKLIHSAHDFEAEMTEVVRKNKRKWWGFKDPKTSLTLPAWMLHINEITDDPVFYICMRKPEKIAESQAKRSGKAYDRWRMPEVSKEYYRRIIAFMQEYLEL